MDLKSLDKMLVSKHVKDIFRNLTPTLGEMSDLGFVDFAQRDFGDYWQFERVQFPSLSPWHPTFGLRDFVLGTYEPEVGSNTSSASFIVPYEGFDFAQSAEFSELFYERILNPNLRNRVLGKVAHYGNDFWKNLLVSVLPPAAVIIAGCALEDMALLGGGAIGLAFMMGENESGFVQSRIEIEKDIAERKLLYGMPDIGKECISGKSILAFLKGEQRQQAMVVLYNAASSYFASQGIEVPHHQVVSDIVDILVFNKSQEGQLDSTLDQVRRHYPQFNCFTPSMGEELRSLISQRSSE
jgi:hypothetical protein